MSRINDCLDLLRQLVSIPSESQNEEAHARFLETYLRDELGMETQLIHVEGKSYNVRGRWPLEPGSARRKLMLGGHLDTVGPTDLWKTDPYRLVQQGDRLHGLGAGDMKGGLAAQLMVLKSLKEQGFLWDNHATALQTSSSFSLVVAITKSPYFAFRAFNASSCETNDFVFLAHVP